MEPIEFNLLEEPWIRVMRSDCGVEELSLTDTLLRAQDYRGLGGELPTQDVAVLRLLLAVLQTVFSRVDENGEAAPLEDKSDAFDRWKALWELGSFPEKPIRGYLEKWRDRFWLFHNERPFYQVPEAAVGTAYGAAKLNGEMSESSNKLKLFPVRTGKEKNGVPYSEAARWLLYVNGYDDTSSKAKQKDLPSPGAGWLGKLGLIYADGRNLFETLMLNLVLTDQEEDCWEAPCPVWERDKPCVDERIEVALPQNQAELLTLQSRRLLLNRYDDRVIGYNLLGGEFFQRANAAAEQMTVWRRVDQKKNEPPCQLPRRHDPSRQLWRDFSIITGMNKEVWTPGVVQWISRLKSRRILDDRAVISFRTAAVQYGDKDFFVTDVFCDHLDFHMNLLTDQAEGWMEMIRIEIGKCEEAANIIGYLSDGLCKAAGGDRVSKAQYAKERFFAGIDLPFRSWLMTLDPAQGDDEAQRNSAEAAWRITAYHVACRLGKEMVEQAGSVAYAGREITENIKGKTEKRYYSSPMVYNQFIWQIRKCFEIEAAKEASH